MNLSPAWVPFLEEQGITATHWSAVGDVKAPDSVIMDWARNSGYVVFTHDLDFSVLVAKAGDNGPSVFQMRTLDLVPSSVGAEVVRVLGEHAEMLERGAIVTLDSSSARVRALPVRTLRRRT